MLTNRTAFCRRYPLSDLQYRTYPFLGLVFEFKNKLTEGKIGDLFTPKGVSYPQGSGLQRTLYQSYDTSLSPVSNGGLPFIQVVMQTFQRFIMKKFMFCVSHGVSVISLFNPCLVGRKPARNLAVTLNMLVSKLILKSYNISG